MAKTEQMVTAVTINCMKASTYWEERNAGRIKDDELYLIEPDEEKVNWADIKNKPEVYTKDECDNKYQTKGDYAIEAEVYTKDECDEKYLPKNSLGGFQFGFSMAGGQPSSEIKGVPNTKHIVFDKPLLEYGTRQEIFNKCASKSDVYTKQECDEKFALIGSTTTTTGGGTVITSLDWANITNKPDLYTKIECDNRYQTKGNFANAADVYTKTQCDSKYAAQANTYDKTETDDNFAKKVDIYTKTESDDRYQAKGDYLTTVPSEYLTETDGDTKYVQKATLFNGNAIVLPNGAEIEVIP